MALLSFGRVPKWSPPSFLSGTELYFAVVQHRDHRTAIPWVSGRWKSRWVGMVQGHHPWVGMPGLARRTSAAVPRCILTTLCSLGICFPDSSLCDLVWRVTGTFLYSSVTTYIARNPCSWCSTTCQCSSQDVCLFPGLVFLSVVCATFSDQATYDPRTRREQKATKAEKDTEGQL